MAWVSYRKHRQAKLEEYERSDARASSVVGDAQYNPELFYTDQQIETLERRCIAEGTLISESRSGHRRTYFLDAKVQVGVCSGEFTTFVFTEITSGEFHGRPISKTALAELGVRL